MNAAKPTVRPAEEESNPESNSGGNQKGLSVPKNEDGRWD